MLKKIIALTLATTAFPTAVYAQSFPKPTDVPDYVAVPYDLDTNGNQNLSIMDSTVTPPPMGSGLVNIPVPSETGRVLTTADLTESSFIGSVSGTTLTVETMNSGTVKVGQELPVTPGLMNGPKFSITAKVSGTGGVGTYTIDTSQTIASRQMYGSNPNYLLTVPFGGTGSENKFRTQADFCFFAPNDPIRNFGQNGMSHLHAFYGNCGVTANSTYMSLRKHALLSTAAGGDSNGTAYWVPALISVNPFGNGINYAIKINGNIIYYNENPAKDGTGMWAKTEIPVGLRYVFGFDMDSSSPSTQFAWMQPELDAINAVEQANTGRVNRYRPTNPATGYNTIRMTFVCAGATPSVVNYIVNPDGSDPHAGTCNDGQDYYALLSAPSCWDGKNLWSPGGYKHLIGGIWDTKFSQFICPRNYYRIPQLVQEIKYTQHGWTDRQKWAFSSDLAYRSAKGLTNLEVPAGSTGHGDWFYGWDRVLFRTAQTKCMGIEHTIGHECNSSQFRPNGYFIGGYSGEINAGGQQISFTSEQHKLSTDTGWIPIPSAWSGSMSGMTMHH